MNWQALSTWEAEKCFRGTVFRFPAKYPFEDMVDFMVIEDATAPIRLKLICSTGYHAGQTELVFPEESAYGQNCIAISVSWIKKNWNEWIYPECDINDVTFIEQYSANV